MLPARTREKMGARHDELGDTLASGPSSDAKPSFLGAPARTGEVRTLAERAQDVVREVLQVASPWRDAHDDRSVVRPVQSVKQRGGLKVVISVDHHAGRGLTHLRCPSA